MVCALLAGAPVTLAVSAGAQTDTQAQTQARLETNEAVARHDARALLEELRLPPGAVRSASEPSGDRRALRPSRVAALNTVGVDEWWTSRAPVAAVIAYVKAHRPHDRGYYQLGVQVSPPPAIVFFDWTIDGPHLFSQQLRVTVTRLADGRTGVLADARSVWMVPRPAGERVPAGVRRVVVSLRIGRGPDGMRHQHNHVHALTSAPTVAKVVAELNSLPISQPGLMYMCPAIFNGRPQLTLRFLSAAGATLARTQVSVYPGRHGASGWTSCDPIQFWIGAHRQTSLTSHTFVTWVGALIGADIS